MVQPEGLSAVLTGLMGMTIHRTRRYYSRPLLVVFVCVALSLSAPPCGAENGFPLGVVTGPPAHPDGAVGHPALTIGGRYTTQYSDRWQGGLDFQALRAGLDVVPHRRLTFHASYTLVDRLARYHDLLGGGSFYFSNPLSARPPANPDGPLKAPVLTILAGARLYDETDSSAAYLGDFRLTLPLSPRLSLGAGYRWFERRTGNDPIAGYGLLNFYFADYPADSAWANPDGPPGFPALRLLAGAATDTYGGSLQFLAPVQSDLTFSATLGVDRLADPERTAYWLDLGLAWYIKQ